MWAACALTGTLAFDGGPGQGRRALTLLPDLHVCVVREEQIVETVPELIRQDGYAFVYESESAFLGDAFGRRLRMDRGVKIEVLQGPQVRDFGRNGSFLAIRQFEQHVDAFHDYGKLCAEKLDATGLTDFVGGKNAVTLDRL